LMRLAGNPPFCACSLMACSFWAMYTQKILLSVTKLSIHWILGPMALRTVQDFWEMAFSSFSESFPAPGISRSIIYLGMIDLLFSFGKTSATPGVGEVTC